MFIEKEIRKLAEERYGHDIHLWAKQRDGFVVGFKQAVELINLSKSGIDGSNAAIEFKEQLKFSYTEDFHHENGNYQNKCSVCGKMFFGHKRRTRCKLCV